MKILILLLFGTFIVTYGDVIDQSNNFLDELPFDEDALKGKKKIITQKKKWRILISIDQSIDVYNSNAKSS